MSRSRLREQVFILLYESEFYDPAEMSEQISLHLEGLDFEADEESLEFIRARAESVLEKCAELDSMIGENATGWAIDRIGKVELAIMRLAVFEMRFDESIPTGVAINEAVELAKKYGQDGAGAFVNGVLAKFAD
ncbi:MAG: transcription antitermination factor NusB [Lachnospiraceae bacterium]|nr:transcription antitermination factor NusB [Lachnospiraceae bacterium]